MLGFSWHRKFLQHQKDIWLKKKGSYGELSTFLSSVVFRIIEKKKKKRPPVSGQICDPTCFHPRLVSTCVVKYWRIELSFHRSDSTSAPESLLSLKVNVVFTEHVASQIYEDYHLITAVKGNSQAQRESPTFIRCVLPHVRFHFCYMSHIHLFNRVKKLTGLDRRNS